MHHQYEFHTSPAGARLNWLRASVLGANDGIVSIAGLLFGIAGATSSESIIFASGIAGIIAGALSMAVGEFISVSGSRDSERALLNKERIELATYPEQELEELASIYKQKGLSDDTALTVAKELTARDAFAAHAEAELKIDPEHLANPWQSAVASAGAFFLGAIIPFAAIVLPPEEWRIPIASGSVVLALILTGALSAWAGGAPVFKAIVRVVSGGVLAMAITYLIGVWIGVSLF